MNALAAEQTKPSGTFFGCSGSSPPQVAAFGDSRLPERFWDKVEPEPNTGCWLWAGAPTTAGYGYFLLDGKHLYAHRVSYSALVGAITPGLVIDHLCSQPCCVNPSHLQQVTRRQNTVRGWARVRAGLAASTSVEYRSSEAKLACGRRYKSRMRSAGKCEDCGSADLKTKLFCASCASVRSARQSLRRRELIAAGICGTCRSRTLAPDSKIYCVGCRAKYRERRRSRRDANGRAAA